VCMGMWNASTASAAPFCLTPMKAERWHEKTASRGDKRRHGAGRRKGDEGELKKLLRTLSEKSIEKHIDTGGKLGDKAPVSAPS